MYVRFVTANLEQDYIYSKEIDGLSGPSEKLDASIFGPLYM